MDNIYTYWALFILFCSILSTVVFFSALTCWDNVQFNFKKHPILFNIWESAWFAGCILFPLLCLPSVLTFYLLGFITDTQPSFLKANKNIDEKVQEFSKRAEELSNSLNAPKDLTFNEMEQIVTKTLDVAKEVSIYAKVQHQEITSLRTEVIKAKETASVEQENARLIRSLAKDQLNAVKLLITEDAKEQADQSFIRGMVWSFPIGILASYLASFFFKRFPIHSVIKRMSRFANTKNENIVGK